MADSRGDRRNPHRFDHPALWRSDPAGSGGRKAEHALLDRRMEKAAIDRVLGSVRDGFSGTLVVRGGPGVGKTALLRYAIDSAPDLQVCGATGVEAEINLDFGALYQLLVPFLSRIPDLGPPQRHALRVAFGLEEGVPPSRFLVGLAALMTLSRAAEDKPVLCLVDDAQWLDAESAQALAFAARRLYADRVGMIVAMSEPATLPEPATLQVFEGLPTVVVGGLPDAEAAELLRRVAGAHLDEQVARRILEDTQRNPLALAELGAQFTADQLAGRASLPEPIPVSQRLAQRFMRQVRDLPTDTQAFLLLAGADIEGDRVSLWRAASLAGIDADAAAAAAEAADLVELSGSLVWFRHPLIRSAVYHGATDAQRRAAHLALAEASDSGSAVGRSRRAWHRAAAAIAPDEGIAAGLEEAAECESARGGYAARAALLRRAVELTPDDGRRAGREVALAEAELISGHPDTARDIVTGALPRLTDDRQRGLAKRLNGAVLFATGDAAAAADALEEASQALAPGDRAAARDAILEATRAAIWAGPAQTRKITSAARSFPGLTGTEPTVSDLLLEGWQARFTAGYGPAVAPLRAAVAALRADDLDPATGLQWFEMGVAAAGSLWDDQGFIDLTSRWVHAARTLGALTELPVALAWQAYSAAVTGRFQDADTRLAELRELIMVSPRPGLLGIDSLCEGLLLAYRGKLAAARASGIAQIRESTARGQRKLAEFGQYIVAVADLCAGDCDAAAAAARAVIDDDTPATAERALPELIEAAARAGHREVAGSAFETMSERTLAAGTPWALGLRSRCAALIDDGECAEEHYQEAISQLQRCRTVVDLACTHLLFGQWLRRARRRRDARRELRIAWDMFTAMGADGFAGQAATELRATGERARTRSPETSFDLTPREAGVADLAAAGASNTDIAAQLFISPRTVEHHLGNVFRKLGITSRTQLARLRPASA
jgi:DNA-binding CsgD family transcriptional regulator/tetratricopeptide (TPR) repeat protein